MMTPIDSETTDREIVVSRLIEGPPDLVFEVFSDAAHLGRWWGPNGFSITTTDFEFAVGGEWLFVMHGPDGTAYPNWIRFEEISSAERIVLVHGEGPDDPDAFRSIVTFVGTSSGTDVTLRSVFPTKELRNRAVEEFHAIEGGKQTLRRLAGYVTQLERSE